MKKVTQEAIGIVESYTFRGNIKGISRNEGDRMNTLKRSEFGEALISRMWFQKCRNQIVKFKEGSGSG